MFLRDLLRGLRIERVGHAPVEVAPPPRVAGTWPLDVELVRFPGGDALTARDLMTGVQIFGASGSGKTSGSLAVLASAMLRHGWGMLVLTTKPGEAEQWERWAGAAGRTGDVLRIRPDGQHHFNLLEYLNRHPDPGASIATNIGDMLMTLAKHAKPKAQGTEASEFFAESATRMVTQAIHLLRGAGEPLTLTAISKVIAGAPSHPLEVEEQSFADGFVAGLLRRAQERGAPLIEGLCEYWLREYPGMNERTRGDVVSTLTSVIFRFTEPPFRELIASRRVAQVVFAKQLTGPFHPCHMLRRSFGRRCLWRRSVLARIARESDPPHHPRPRNLVLSFEVLHLLTQFQARTRRQHPDQAFEDVGHPGNLPATDRRRNSGHLRCSLPCYR